MIALFNLGGCLYKAMAIEHHCLTCARINPDAIGTTSLRHLAARDRSGFVPAHRGGVVGLDAPALVPDAQEAAGFVRSASSAGAAGREAAPGPGHPRPRGGRACLSGSVFGRRASPRVRISVSWH